MLLGIMKTEIESSTEVTEGEKEKEMNSQKCLYLFTLMTLQNIPHG